MSDFGAHLLPRGRKEYACTWCHEPIPRGELHLQYIGRYEDDWQNWRVHLPCYGAFWTQEEDYFCDEAEPRAQYADLLPSALREVHRLLTNRGHTMEAEVVQAEMVLCALR